MTDANRHALVIGAGAGLSASLARALAARGIAVSLAARSTGDLAGLAEQTGARLHACDAADRHQIRALFEALDHGPAGAPDILVYNPSARVRGPLVELDGAAVEHAVQVTALGAFHASQEAARRMLRQGRGTILLTGASAGVKGYPNSAPFAMGKFALRGLAQSMARELQPQGIHVAHVVIDGAIRNPSRPGFEGDPARPDALLDPDAIAATYMALLDQHRSAWAWEIELRPWLERF